MADFDRRRFLASLTAFAALPALPISATPAASARSADFDANAPEASRSGKDWWFVSREHPLIEPTTEVEQQVNVDFWSMPFCDFDYAKYLPLGISVTKLWYDYPGGKNLSIYQALDEFRREQTFRRADSPRSVGVHVGGTESLGDYLAMMAKDDIRGPSVPRVALIALDSLGPMPDEPSWEHLLRIIKADYDLTIGLVHAPFCGRQILAVYLDSASYPHSPVGHGCKESYFDESVWRSARHCDGVFVTRAAYDFEGPRIRRKVGEVVRWLGRSVLDRRTLGQLTAV